MTFDTDLGRQIQAFHERFTAICREATGIASGPHMPDAASQLNGVLEETEVAASEILTAGNEIDQLITNAIMPQDVKQSIQAQITRIYEASSFQDISGQRIKKVLRNLHELEAQLGNLLLAAGGKLESSAAASAVKTDDAALLNGPQPTANAPSQADVDALFG